MKRDRQEELTVVIQLKEAIQSSGRTHRDIAKAADVGPDQLSRFMAGKRDLTLATASRVCDALGLELAPKKPRKEKK